MKTLAERESASLDSKTVRCRGSRRLTGEEKAIFTKRDFGICAADLCLRFEANFVQPAAVWKKRTQRPRAVRT